MPRNLIRRLDHWLGARVRDARLRARADRALPWTIRLRRELWRGAGEIGLWYGLLNLFLVHCVPMVVTARIDCTVVDADTGQPLPEACVQHVETAREGRCDASGAGCIELRSAPGLIWAWPMLGSFPLGGRLRGTAVGYRTVDVPLPAAFDWPLFGIPHISVEVRLPR
jgi:hypothetical protein